MRFLLAALLMFGSQTSWAGLPATFNGLNEWQAAPDVWCQQLEEDLTYSVCAVVVPDPSTATSSTGRAIFSAASDSSSTAYVSLGYPDNQLVPEFTHRSGSTFYFARATSAIQFDGQAHTLFGVANVGTISLYVDGVLVDSRSLSGATPSSRAICTYGALRRSNGYLGSFWQGEIRAVRTWDYAVSEEQLALGCGDVTPPQNLACHGHTGLIWDPYTDLAVDRFQAERTIKGTDSWRVVGDTRYKNREAYTDEDGVTYPAVRAETWDLLRTTDMPVSGMEYSYRMVAVRPDGERSAPSNVVTCGPQDPTRCFQDGFIVSCVSLPQ